MKKLIVYDLDGTLVDTARDIGQAANHMIRTLGAPEIPLDEICSYVGRGLNDLVARCLKTHDLKRVEEGAKIYRRFYREHMLDHSRPFPGALECLKFFCGRGAKQAVITNKPNPFSVNMVYALDLFDYFETVVPGNSDYPKKPDPSALQALAEKMQVEPSEVLFIGDSEVDVNTGKNAGVDTVALTQGFGTREELQAAKPNWIVQNFQELIELAKKENW